MYMPFIGGNSLSTIKCLKKLFQKYYDGKFLLSLLVEKMAPTGKCITIDIITTQGYNIREGAMLELNFTRTSISTIDVCNNNLTHEFPSSGGGLSTGNDGGGGGLATRVNEDVIQDILYPDCSSFEFTNGLNNTVKGAHVAGVNNTFTAYESVSPSVTNINVINILYPTLFFTMPAGWTNGRSVTLATQALSTSISITEKWFIANPSATQAEIQSVWMKNMQLQMGYKGGSVGTTPLFSVRSPSPYKKRFFGTGNCG